MSSWVVQDQLISQIDRSKIYKLYLSAIRFDLFRFDGRADRAPEVFSEDLFMTESEFNQQVFSPMVDQLGRAYRDMVAVLEEETKKNPYLDVDVFRAKTITEMGRFQRDMGVVSREDLADVTAPELGKTVCIDVEGILRSTKLVDRTLKQGRTYMEAQRPILERYVRRRIAETLASRNRFVTVDALSQLGGSLSSKVLDACGQVFSELTVAGILDCRFIRTDVEPLLSGLITEKTEAGVQGVTEKIFEGMDAQSLPLDGTTFEKRLPAFQLREFIQMKAREGYHVQKAAAHMFSVPTGIEPGGALEGWYGRHASATLGIELQIALSDPEFVLSEQESHVLGNLVTDLQEAKQHAQMAWLIHEEGNVGKQAHMIGEMAALLDQRIARLAPGQSVQFGGGWTGHAIFHQIRNAGASGLIFETFNTGDGLSMTHETADGMKPYHTPGKEVDTWDCCYAIGGIEPDRIDHGFLSTLLRFKWIDDHTSAEFYGGLLPTLGGTELPPNKDPNAYRRGQLVGNCSLECLLAFLETTCQRQSVPELYPRILVKMGTQVVENFKGVLTRPDVTAQHILDMAEAVQASRSR
ncbi:MAG: hypothetical protein ACI9BD_001327 [Candidatus Marinamargulisbacteria bacterium]